MKRLTLVLFLLCICFEASAAPIKKIRVQNIDDVSKQPWLVTIINGITKETDFARTFPGAVKITCHEEIRDFMENLDFQYQDTEDITNLFYMSVDYCADSVWANRNKK